MTYEIATVLNRIRRVVFLFAACCVGWFNAAVGGPVPGSPSYLRPGTTCLTKFRLDLGYTTGQFGKNHLGDHPDAAEGGSLRQMKH
jgi:arylsulfatase A-like enzyme